MQELSLNILDVVQNAITAGATLIEIAVQTDSRNRLMTVSVADNGCGMTAEDARRAFLRHATSKLRTAEDLAVIDSAHTDKINAFVASDQRRKGFSKVAERHTVYAVGSEFSVQRRTGAGLRGYLEAAARDFSRQFEQRNAEADASG